MRSGAALRTVKSRMLFRAPKAEELGTRERNMHSISPIFGKLFCNCSKLRDFLSCHALHGACCYSALTEENTGKRSLQKCTEKGTLRRHRNSESEVEAWDVGTGRERGRFLQDDVDIHRGVVLQGFHDHDEVALCRGQPGWGM